MKTIFFCSVSLATFFLYSTKCFRVFLGQDFFFSCKDKDKSFTVKCIINQNWIRKWCQNDTFLIKTIDANVHNFRWNLIFDLLKSFFVACRRRWQHEFYLSKKKCFEYSIQFLFVSSSLKNNENKKRKKVEFIQLQY